MVLSLRKEKTFSDIENLGKIFLSPLSDFKLNIQKTKIIASGPITSWQIDGETVADFIFLGSKITADADCSHVKDAYSLEGKL